MDKECQYKSILTQEEIFDQMYKYLRETELTNEKRRSMEIELLEREYAYCGLQYLKECEREDFC